MRFPADELRLIRAGKIRATLRPYNRRPIRYQVGRAYAIERVDDVRNEIAIAWDDVGNAIETRIQYERQVERLNTAWVEIAAAYNRVTDDGAAVVIHREPGEPEQDHGKPLLLDELPERVVRACGFDELDELVDVFRTDRGGPSFQRVWAIEFIFQDAPARLLGKYVAGGPDEERGYTRSHATAIDELEAVDDETLDRFTKRGRTRHARHRRKDLADQLASCRTPEERVQVLRREAERRGVDVRSDIRALERRVLEKIGKAA